jgi:hypothetical protein
LKRLPQHTPDEQRLAAGLALPAPDEWGGSGWGAVSMIPFGLLDVRPLVLPATDVVFALPMPSVAIHCGPIAMFPPHAQVPWPLLSSSLS